ncbi:hypothetical protein HMPREF1624_02221 [Sporothrix schenckii ATCC 58251]|uniref:Uncharacterized protein n=1 Tax=Sporothrix schenckii (strain ATCC 58251 / de Perez 2211183) TaxID=1391915 RepID=U7Q1X5_SPOS1|nr:hypothetical protein HMPREF1624_02221 [Sporothrix schenckii ATCC 58251]
MAALRRLGRAVDSSEEQYDRTLAINLTAPFFVTKYALPHLQKGSGGHGGTVMNTVSVDAYVGPPTHLDYAVSKGGLVTFTRTLANQQAKNGIRVNGVAPGPIWTPLIEKNMNAGKVTNKRKSMNCTTRYMS